MHRVRYALLAATLLAAGGGFVLAQPASTYDPAQLPTIHGKVAQYTLTPRGDVDGLILDDGTEVHLPPHLSTQLVYAVKPGDTVTIHGLKARAVPMVAASSIANDATGQTVVDNGPPARPRGPAGGGQSIEAQGRVKQQLHGPRGDLNGVVLEDGTIIRLPPPEAERLASQLAPGQTVYARGDGLATPLGKVIAARAIGPSKDQTTALAAPPPGFPWRHGHGPGREAGPPPPHS